MRRKKDMSKIGLVLAIICLFVGASVVPIISGTNIRSIKGNERVYVFKDMTFVENPLSKGVVFEDDFDTGNTPGQDPVGWSVIEVGDADVSITGATYVSSPYSVELNNPSDSAINLYHGFTPLSEGTVECCLRSSADGCWLGIDNEENDWGIQVSFWSGKIMYIDPSGYQDMDPPFTYTPNTWYHFRFEFDCDNDTYDIYIDDVLKKEDALMKYPSTLLNEIWISCEYDCVCTGYLDNVKISETGAPDNDPPEISNVTLTFSDPKDTLLGNPPFFSGGWENFTCTVTDDVMVDTVQLNLTYNTTTTYHTMIKDGDNYYFNTTLTVPGGINTPGYTYNIYANDTSGKDNTSTPEEFDLPMNEDVNLDGKAHFMDLVAVSIAYNDVGPNGWIREDINNDGKAHFMDLVAVSIAYNDVW